MNAQPLIAPKGNARSGAALVTVMCFALLVSVMVAIVLKASASNMKAAQEQIHLEKALYVAQAGLETAAYRLGKDSITPPWSGDGRIGDGSFCVVVIAGATPAAGWHSIGGEVAVNPNNSPDNELTIKLANGTTIVHDDLSPDYPGYLGPATNVVIKPKGGGNQIGLLVDGAPFAFNNSLTYDVYSLTMTVYVYNDHVNAQGKAIGKWHVAMAATEAQIQTY